MTDHIDPPPLSRAVRRRGAPPGDLPDDPLATALGRAIATARLAAGVSRRELARSLAIDSSHLSRVERGLRLPSLRHLFRLGRVLGRPASSIVADAERTLAAGSPAGVATGDQRARPRPEPLRPPAGPWPVAGGGPAAFPDPDPAPSSPVAAGRSRRDGRGAEGDDDAAAD